MGNQICKWTYIDAYEVAEHCGEEPEFTADILNNMGGDLDNSTEWLRSFAAALDDTGEAVLRALVARLNAIDAADMLPSTALPLLIIALLAAAAIAAVGLVWGSTFLIGAGAICLLATFFLVLDRL